MSAAWGWVLVPWLAGIATFGQDGGDDAAGEAGRAALVQAVQKALTEAKAPRPAPLEPQERAFGLPFTAVEGTGMRVLCVGGEEEGIRVATAMGAARTLFVELTGASAFFPAGLRAYLLGTSETRDAFLARHPKLGPEASARFAKLEGTGIPGTADWVWWEGDAEKRYDAMVRFSFDWLARTQGVTLEEQAWLHEGLGHYLTHALTGTHLTWFVQPRRPGGKSDAQNVALRAQMDEPGADWMALARGLFAPERKFDLEELLHLAVDELEAIDYVRANALVGYLVEVRRDALGAVVTRVGAREDPRVVLEETLGYSLGQLRERLHSWLERRDVLVAKAEGRRSDAELEAQWKDLGKPQRVAAVEALGRLLGETETQQLRWMRTVLARAPAEIPKAQPTPYYDPKTHAPAQPIARKRLTATDPRVKRLLKDIGKPEDERAPTLAYDYDWNRGQVVRVGKPDDPETVFRNALLGIPPGADLARALVLAEADVASERKVQAAFAHAYTDRDGNVFPLTLFDMLSSGQTIEMPDVDTLGIVHEVLDEWNRWVAPVPASQHEILYKRIGELFQPVRRSRELRLALADLFLCPSAPPIRGYETQTLNLHALWAGQENDPAKLGAALPDGKGWETFLADLLERCQRDYKYYAQGRRRAAQLRLDAIQLKKVLGAALDEGARYVPPPEPVEAGGR